jgi:hypothetical protein
VLAISTDQTIRERFLAGQTGLEEAREITAMEMYKLSSTALHKKVGRGLSKRQRRAGSKLFDYEV